MKAEMGQMPGIDALAFELDRYYQEDLIRSPQFQTKLKQLEGDEGESFHDDVFTGLFEGAGRIAVRVDQFAMMQNPVKRRVLVQQLEMEIGTVRWDTRVFQWNQAADPYGIAFLKEDSNKDAKEILAREIEQSTEELAEIRAYKRASAHRFGADIMIDLYKGLLGIREERQDG